MRLPDSFQKLVDLLADLPSIGPRQAIRLVFYLIHQGQNNIQNLSRATDDLKKIKICERCFFIHQNPGALCDICGNSGRRQDIIAVIEKETDLMSLENTGRFNGCYFILGEISKSGVLDDRQKLRLQGLKSFIEKNLPSPSTNAQGSASGQAEEIILGFNPTSVGNFNASLIEKELKPLAKKISRLGRGLPTGGEIEFADDETLGSALERRG
ncbi:MAG: recombination protein RecR [Candidatus Liptonbacteria bacterium]|nr:recombination protein RecR [Candidatus Liptonbacteria bacterium]